MSKIIYRKVRTAPDVKQYLDAEKTQVNPEFETNPALVYLLVSLIASSAASFISCERTASEGSSILVKRYVSIVGFIS